MELFVQVGRGKKEEEGKREKEERKGKREERRENRRKMRKKEKKERKMKECHAVSKPKRQRTQNCATRGRFPPTSIILHLGAM